MWPESHRIGVIRAPGPRAERVAEEPDLQQQQVLRDDLLRGHVRDARQRQHLVRTPGREQRRGQPQGVRGDDVVVGEAVDDHQRAVRTVRGRRGRGVVDDRRADVGLAARHPEVALGVVGVVERPVGDRRAGDGRVEDVGPAQHRQRGQVAAERPAADADPAQVEVRVGLGGRVQGRDLVLQHRSRQVAVDRAVELRAAAGEPRPGRAAPAAGCRARGRTAGTPRCAAPAHRGSAAPGRVEPGVDGVPGDRVLGPGGGDEHGVRRRREVLGHAHGGAPRCGDGVHPGRRRHRDRLGPRGHRPDGHRGRLRRGAEQDGLAVDADDPAHLQLRAGQVGVADDEPARPAGVLGPHQRPGRGAGRDARHVLHPHRVGLGVQRGGPPGRGVDGQGADLALVARLDRQQRAVCVPARGGEVLVGLVVPGHGGAAAVERDDDQTHPGVRGAGGGVADRGRDAVGVRRVGDVPACDRRLVDPGDEQRAAVGGPPEPPVAVHLLGRGEVGQAPGDVVAVRGEHGRRRAGREVVQVQRALGDEGHPGPVRVDPRVHHGLDPADVERADVRLTGQRDGERPPGQCEHGAGDGGVGGVSDDAARLLPDPLAPGPLRGGQVLLARQPGYRRRIHEKPLGAGRGVDRPQAGDRVGTGPAAQEHRPRPVRGDGEPAGDPEGEAAGAGVQAGERSSTGAPEPTGAPPHSVRAPAGPPVTSAASGHPPADQVRAVTSQRTAPSPAPPVIRQEMLPVGEVNDAGARTRRGRPRWCPRPGPPAPPPVRYRRRAPAAHRGRRCARIPRRRRRPPPRPARASRPRRSPRPGAGRRRAARRRGAGPRTAGHAGRPSGRRGSRTRRGRAGTRPARARRRADRPGSDRPGPVSPRARWGRRRVRAQAPRSTARADRRPDGPGTVRLRRSGRSRPRRDRSAVRGPRPPAAPRRARRARASAGSAGPAGPGRPPARSARWAPVRAPAASRRGRRSRPRRAGRGPGRARVRRCRGPGRRRWVRRRSAASSDARCGGPPGARGCGRRRGERSSVRDARRADRPRTAAVRSSNGGRSPRHGDRPCTTTVRRASPGGPAGRRPSRTGHRTTSLRCAMVSNANDGEGGGDDRGTAHDGHEGTRGGAGVAPAVGMAPATRRPGGDRVVLRPVRGVPRRRARPDPGPRVGARPVRQGGGGVVGLPRDVRRRGRAVDRGRPVRQAHRVPAEPADLLAVLGGGGVLPGPADVPRPALPRRTRAGCRAGARRHLPGGVPAPAGARPLDGVGVHRRLPRGAGGRAARRPARRGAVDRGRRRVALAARRRGSGRVLRAGAAPRAARVPALAGHPRAARGGRRRRGGRGPAGRCPGRRGGVDGRLRGAARRLDPRGAADRVQRGPPHPHGDAPDLPGAPDRRLLRFRHARAAGARGQGLRHHRVARLRRAQLRRVPARLAGLGAAGRAVRAEVADHRLGAGDRRARHRVRGRVDTAGDRRVRLPAHRDQQRVLQRLPHLPGRDLPDGDPLHRGRHRLLAVPGDIGVPPLRRRPAAGHRRAGRGVRRRGGPHRAAVPRRRPARPALHRTRAGGAGLRGHPDHVSQALYEITVNALLDRDRPLTRADWDAAVARSAGTACRSCSPSSPTPGWSVRTCCPGPSPRRGRPPTGRWTGSRRRAGGSCSTTPGWPRRPSRMGRRPREDLVDGVARTVQRHPDQVELLGPGRGDHRAVVVVVAGGEHRRGEHRHRQPAADRPGPAGRRRRRVPGADEYRQAEGRQVGGAVGVGVGLADQIGDAGRDPRRRGTRSLPRRPPRRTGAVAAAGRDPAGGDGRGGGVPRPGTPAPPVRPAGRGHAGPLRPQRPGGALRVTSPASATPGCSAAPLRASSRPRGPGRTRSSPARPEQAVPGEQVRPVLPAVEQRQRARRVPAQVDDLQLDLAERDRVAVLDELVHRGRQLRGVLRVGDQPRLEHARDRAERLPVVGVAVGGDQVAQVRALVGGADEVGDAGRLGRRVDQQRLVAPLAHEQVGVVVHLADRDLADAQPLEVAADGRAARVGVTGVVLQDVHEREGSGPHRHPAVGRTRRSHPRGR
ncbi:hypothetical protein L7F22_017531 [Adiantum nelumboides]|nr:hypothetical protein [Adiantum nelumboides]